MRMLVLKALFKNSPHFIELILPEQEAKDYVKRWSNGDVRKVTLYNDKLGQHWGFDMSEILCMHTADLEALKAQAQEAQKQTQKGLPSQPPLYSPTTRIG